MGFGQGSEKSLIILVVDKRGLSCGSPVHHVVHGLGILDSQGTGHALRTTSEGENWLTVDLTLLCKVFIRPDDLNGLNDLNVSVKECARSSTGQSIQSGFSPSATTKHFPVVDESMRPTLSCQIARARLRGESPNIKGKDATLTTLRGVMWVDNYFQITFSFSGPNLSCTFVASRNVANSFLVSDTPAKRPTNWTLPSLLSPNLKSKRC
jgi:hypothetical protein